MAGFVNSSLLWGGMYSFSTFIIDKCYVEVIYSASSFEVAALKRLDLSETVDNLYDADFRVSSEGPTVQKNELISSSLTRSTGRRRYDHSYRVHSPKRS